MGKQKHNAYSVFVDETFKRRRKAGESNLSKASLFQVLSEEWRAFTDEQKELYKGKAKYYNDNPLPSWIPEEPRNPRTDTNSQTFPMSSTSADVKPEIEKQDIKPRIEEVECRALVPVKRPHEDDSYAVVEHVEKKPKPGLPNYKNLKGSDKIVEPWTLYSGSELLNLLNRCFTIVENRYSRMDTVPLYSISTNVLCKERKKIIDQTDGQPGNRSKINPLEDKFEEFFTPLEISIYAYSLKYGKIGQPYWTLINAGPPPTGFVTAALDHHKTHKITFPPMAVGYSNYARKDYVRVYREMLKYTEDGERILLVSNAKDIAQVKGSLEWLYKKASETSESRLPQPRVWTILPVVEYISAMHHLLYKKLDRPMPRFGYPYWVRMKLEGSILDYNAALMCQYHDISENQCNYCAQVCAIKTFENLGPLLEEIYKIYTTINAKEVIPAITSQNAIDRAPEVVVEQITNPVEDLPKQITM